MFGQKQEKNYLCTAFRVIAVKKSYLICCVGHDKQLII